MKIGLASFIILTTALSPAFADEFKVQSRIDAVTVYPQGADVVRVSAVELAPGEHSLILEDLPGSIDPASLRVEGEGGKGLEIASVDSKIVQLASGDIEAQRRALNMQIENLEDERTALDQTISDAEAQRKIMLSLADKQLQPATTTEAVKAVDAAGLGSLVDLVGARLASSSKTIHDAQLRQKAIDRRVADLQLASQNLVPEQAAHLRVSINVEATSAVKGQIKLKYRTAQAGWLPFYDAKLALPVKGASSKIEIIRRAEVSQDTGEAWDNVAMTLSTARPTGSTAAPDLGEDPIQIAMEDDLRKANGGLAMQAPAPVGMQAKKDKVLDEKSSDGEADAPAAPMVQREAMVALAGFNANYLIQGRVNVDSTGTAKKLRISTDEFNAALQAITVPRLDTHAYLTAGFTMKADAPYLPGVVNLFRDGMFVGQGSLPLLSAGEDAKLGFGADDLISVKRIEVKRKAGMEGIISKSNVQELAWTITIKNLHDVVLPVTVLDRMPYSTQADVTVEALADNTAPSVTDFEQKRGLLAWNLDLDPKAEKQLKTGYKVSAPQAVHISMNP